MSQHDKTDHSPPALDSCRGYIFISTVVGGCRACRGAVDWCVWGNFCQSALLAVGAAAGAELAGGAGRVAARYEATEADAPQEPAG